MEQPEEGGIVHTVPPELVFEEVGYIEQELATLADFFPKLGGLGAVSLQDFTKALLTVLQRVPEDFRDEQVMLRWSPTGFTVYWRRLDPMAMERNQLRELILRHGYPERKEP